MIQNSIVLGSSSGIGLAITKALLEKNNKVIGISRKDFHIDNKDYQHIKLDVTHNIFIDIINKKINLKEVNNLVYCVGINEVSVAKNSTPQQLEKLLNYNLIPAILIAMEFAKSRKLTKPSSILFIGSIWSSVGLPGRSVYGATKSALTGYSKHLSSELSSLGCMVNVLSPGFTDTPLTKKTINDPLIQEMLKRVNTQKLLKTDDVAAHAITLLAPNNKCITGQEIFVDGGFISHA